MNKISIGLLLAVVMMGVVISFTKPTVQKASSFPTVEVMEATDSVSESDVKK